jgi:hypothetical protein
MRDEMTVRASAAPATTRTAIGLLMLCALPLLGACTTVEGTNALTDPATFEREVMTETLKGVGVIPREDKPELRNRRAPLVLPKDSAALPAPTEQVAGVLPEDNDNVQLDTTGLTEDDIKRLRNARVVDPRTLSGRPLTAEETRQLTARMVAARVQVGPRPLYVPPEEYFTTTPSGQELVCLAANGDLVPLTDPACPPEIRNALQAQ